MAKTTFQSVDEYIKAQPEEVRAALIRVRAILRKALPAADELISYNIPAYKQDGGIVIYFAGWNDHYGLYGSTASTVTAFPEELASCEVTKGTIRFQLSKPVPARLIERIAKFRAEEVKVKKAAKLAGRIPRA